MGILSEVSFDIHSLIHSSLPVYISLGIALFLFPDSEKR